MIDSAEEGGLADGATTDRVIAKAKREIAEDLSKIPEHELPDYLRDAHIHLEIISGSINEMLVPLTGARNTSNQVKEFALENLGGGFDWLKELIEGSEFAGRVRYRENDPQPVDIRTVLGLLTLFHPKWNQLGREPLVAFSSKGLVLDYFRDAAWKPGYEALKPVVLDILRLHESIQLEFQGQYNKYKGDGGGSGKLGKRKEIRYNEGKPFTLALSQAQTKYVIPDGWLYPILASFRQLLAFPQTDTESVSWITEPQVFFTEHGFELVADVAEQSQSLGSNPAAVGKSRPLWNNLRKSMELHRMKIEHPVGDALMCAKSRIQGNRFSLTTQKGKTALTVIIPDHVIDALKALPPRADVHPDYFFWSGNSKHKSLTGRWQRKLGAPQRLSLHRERRWNAHEISFAPIVRHLCRHTASEWHQHAGFVQDAVAQIGKDYRKVLFAVGS